MRDLPPLEAGEPRGVDSSGRFIHSGSLSSAFKKHWIKTVVFRNSKLFVSQMIIPISIQSGNPALPIINNKLYKLSNVCNNPKCDSVY
jgi:hypothetical protein